MTSSATDTVRCAPLTNVYDTEVTLELDEETETVTLKNLCTFSADFQGDRVVAQEAECNNVEGSYLGLLGFTERVISSFVHTRSTGEVSIIFRDPRNSINRGDYFACGMMYGVGNAEHVQGAEQFIFSLREKYVYEQLPLNSGGDCGRVGYLSEFEAGENVEEVSLWIQEEVDGTQSVLLENFSCRLSGEERADTARECLPLYEESNELPRLLVDRLEVDENNLILEARVQTTEFEYCLEIKGDRFK